LGLGFFQRGCVKVVNDFNDLNDFNALTQKVSHKAHGKPCKKWCFGNRYSGAPHLWWIMYLGFLQSFYGSAAYSVSPAEDTGAEHPKSL